MNAPLDLLRDSFAGRSLIEASAGTGKTWTLTALYARMLLQEQLSVGQILVVTYTTAEQVRAAREVEALPEGAMLVRMLSDYAVLRDQARACG